MVRLDAVFGLKNGASDSECPKYLDGAREQAPAAPGGQAQGTAAVAPGLAQSTFAISPLHTSMLTG